jgi:hypothetical protein
VKLQSYRIVFCKELENLFNENGILWDNGGNDIIHDVNFPFKTMEQCLISYFIECFSFCDV